MIRASHSLTGPYDYVSKYDEAVDRDTPDFELKWEQYIDGQGEPPLKPGSAPTVFTLRPLSAMEQMRLADFGNVHRLGVAAQMALQKAANLHDVTGRPVKVTFTVEDGVRVASQETLDAIGASALIDIGARVFRSLSPSPRG